MEKLDDSQFKLNRHNFSVFVGIIRTVFYSWWSYKEILTRMREVHGVRRR